MALCIDMIGRGEGMCLGCLCMNRKNYKETACSNGYFLGRKQDNNGDQDLHFCLYACVHAKSLQLCPILGDPMDYEKDEPAEQMSQGSPARFRNQSNQYGRGAHPHQVPKKPKLKG